MITLESSRATSAEGLTSPLGCRATPSRKTTLQVDCVRLQQANDLLGPIRRNDDAQVNHRPQAYPRRGGDAWGGRWGKAVRGRPTLDA